LSVLTGVSPPTTSAAIWPQKSSQRYAWFLWVIGIRTAQYIRLSVEDLKNKGNPIENQKTLLDNFLNAHPELQFYDAYIDNGLSGTSFERPEFKRMLDDIEAGKIECVITKDLSRLGRSMIDAGYYLEQYFPFKKCAFHLCKRQY
jgi:hypothetical protein